MQHTPFGTENGDYGVSAEQPHPPYRGGCLCRTVQKNADAKPYNGLQHAETAVGTQRGTNDNNRRAQSLLRRQHHAACPFLL